MKANLSCTDRVIVESILVECSRWTFTIYIYNQGFSHFVRRNSSMNYLHRRRSLAILGHAGPRCMADKVVSPSCCRSSLSSCLFSCSSLCHSFSPSVVFESCIASRPFMHSLLDNVYDVIYTWLMPYPGITFVVTQSDAEHDALHFALCDWLLFREPSSVPTSHTSLPALFRMLAMHLAECCPSQYNAHLGLSADGLV